jgi:hypothetical protein
MEGNAMVQAVITEVGATAPGVVIALLTYWLAIGRENARDRRARQNALTLLALEIESNRAALGEFWRAINALDPEDATRGADDKETEKHLAAMADAGWLGYTPPELPSVRWDHFPPDALAALSRKQALEIDALYRDLRAVTDLYARMMRIEPEERELLQNRFWYNYFADNRVERFQRLAPVVHRALDARPLGSEQM